MAALVGWLPGDLVSLHVCNAVEVIAARHPLAPSCSNVACAGKLWPGTIPQEHPSQAAFDKLQVGSC
jgi:xanthosine utilization system XapX-like protein